MKTSKQLRNYIPLVTAFLLCFCSSYLNAQCIGPLGNTSAVPPNTDEVNGSFQFNYLITSQLKSDYLDGEEEMVMDYYVNTTDGSILFSKTNLMVNFGATDSDMGSVDAAILMPNGKMVVYVQDSFTNQKRALTLASDRTREDIAFDQLASLTEFYDKSLRLHEVSAPKPDDIPWNTVAYTATISQPNGEDSKITLHFAQNPGNRSIRTSIPFVGLLVGVVKDYTYGKCNRLAVYSRVETREGTVEAKLKDIVPSSISFDASGYKVTTLGHEFGAMSTMNDEEAEEVDANMERLYADLGRLLDQLGDCGDDIDCRERIKIQMTRTQRSLQNMAANLAPNSNALGSEGTDYADQRRALENEMNRLMMKMVRQEADCERLDEAIDNCRSGCVGMEEEKRRCTEELREMREEAEQIGCQLGKLMGIADTMEDCP